MDIDSDFTMEDLPFEVKNLILDFLDAATLCKLSQTSFDWNFIVSNSLRWSSLLLSQFGTKRHERTLYLYNCKILEGNNNIMWMDADDELSLIPSSSPSSNHEEPTLISKGRFFKKMYAGLVQFFSWHSYDIPTLQQSEIPYALEAQDMRRVGALGGQRVVFKSHHKPSNQPCIIEKICDRMQERKVLREIKHLRMLRDGPNIPKLVDAFKEVTLPIQVDQSAASAVPPSAELTEGPLSRMVFEYRDSLFYPQYFMSLNQERIRKITFEVLQTLDFIHSKGFAHRDIKPLSIEVSPDFSSVFITNWYFLERYDEEVNFVEPLSLSVSSRYYKSPEILFRNDKFLYDPRKLDMWSLGCTLAAMAIRVPIFKGADLNDQLIKIVQILGTTDFKQFCQRYKVVPPAFLEATLLDEQYATRTDLRSLRVPACPYSEEAVDLVEKLLRYDPAERLSASEALKHPFLAGMSAGAAVPQPMHCQPYQ